MAGNAEIGGNTARSGASPRPAPFVFGPSRRRMLMAPFTLIWPLFFAAVFLVFCAAGVEVIYQNKDIPGSGAFLFMGVGGASDLLSWTPIPFFLTLAGISVADVILFAAVWTWLAVITLWFHIKNRNRIRPLGGNIARTGLAVIWAGAGVLAYVVVYPGFYIDLKLAFFALAALFPARECCVPAAVYFRQAPLLFSKSPSFAAGGRYILDNTGKKAYAVKDVAGIGVSGGGSYLTAVLQAGGPWGALFPYLFAKFSKSRRSVEITYEGEVIFLRRRAKAEDVRAEADLNSWIEANTARRKKITKGAHRVRIRIGPAGCSAAEIKKTLEARFPGLWLSRTASLKERLKTARRIISGWVRPVSASAGRKQAAKGGAAPDPRVIGHRGAAAYAPENTLASFRKAAALGCGFVEFDVVLTRDGRPAVFHDSALERTTNGAGDVADTDWADIARLDAGAWFGAEFQGEPVPSLRRAVECLRETGMGANVEIKPAPGCEKKTGAVTAQVLAEVWPGALPPPLLSSFSETALAAARETAPQFPRAFLVKNPAEAGWETVCAGLQCVSLHAHEKFITPEVVKRAHEKGLTVRAYTVNGPARAKQLFDLGVDGVFSDAPDKISAAPGRP